VNRAMELGGACSAGLDAGTWLTSAGDDLQALASHSSRADRGGRTADALTNLGRVHTELGEGAAQCIAVHAKLFCSFTLIAAMASENLEDITLLKFAYRVGV